MTIMNKSKCDPQTDPCIPESHSSVTAFKPSRTSPVILILEYMAGNRKQSEPFIHMYQSLQ